MYTRELIIFGEPARVTCPNPRSVFIEVDGFRASLSELKALQLIEEGCTMDQIALKLGKKHGTIANRLWKLRERNDTTGGKDFHYEGVAAKARMLELTSPLALTGLQVILDERNKSFISPRVAASDRYRFNIGRSNTDRPIPVTLPTRLGVRESV
jgi:hypothetical protein